VGDAPWWHDAAVGEREELGVAETLAVVAHALAVDSDLTAVILGACRLAVATIEACEHADVMVVAPGGTLTVPAATDWVGIRVVSYEEEYREGPCIDAFRNGVLVDAPDLSTEVRWPRFTRRCLAETPVRSGVGLPLLIGDRPPGALDMYAASPHAFYDEDRAVAALFATHAAVAIEAGRERLNFEQALATRDVIGQAKGILMAQSHMSADDAFDLLRRASQRLNVKLTTVAQEIVDKNPSC
jgi:GAF domain-containing protein